MCQGNLQNSYYTVEERQVRDPADPEPETQRGNLRNPPGPQTSAGPLQTLAIAAEIIVQDHRARIIGEVEHQFRLARSTGPPNSRRVLLSGPGTANSLLKGSTDPLTSSSYM